MKWHAELDRQLQQQGINLVSLEQRRKCVALTLKRGGATVKYYTGITPSDYRALQNAVADITRLIRIQEGK
jgi:hypothetical protein